MSRTTLEKKFVETFREQYPYIWAIYNHPDDEDHSPHYATFHLNFETIKDHISDLDYVTNNYKPRKDGEPNWTQVVTVVKSKDISDGKIMKIIVPTNMVL